MQHRGGAELLFQALTEREEKNSVAIASNGPIGGWTQPSPTPCLCTAIVDRLTFQRHHHRGRHRLLPPRLDASAGRGTGDGRLTAAGTYSTVLRPEGGGPSQRP